MESVTKSYFIQRNYTVSIYIISWSNLLYFQEMYKNITYRTRKTVCPLNLGCEIKKKKK